MNDDDLIHGRPFYFTTPPEIAILRQARLADSIVTFVTFLPARHLNSVAVMACSRRDDRALYPEKTKRARSRLIARGCKPCL
jgi:hypothetical protein